MRPDRQLMRCSRNRRRSMLQRGRSGQPPDRNNGRRCQAMEERDVVLTRSLTTRTPRSRLCRHKSRLPGANRTKRNRRRVRAFSPIRWRYAITSSARRGSNRGARRRRVVFDRPNFKESTEQLFLQIAQADQVDRPILIRLPFTPPISSDNQ